MDISSKRNVQGTDTQNQFTRQVFIKPAFPPFTGIFWCWSQVSRTQADNFCPVRKLWRKVSVQVLLTTPGEEQNGFDSITSIFGHILTYLEEEFASEHQEGPKGPPSTWANQQNKDATGLWVTTTPRCSSYIYVSFLKVSSMALTITLFPLNDVRFFYSLTQIRASWAAPFTAKNS